MKSDKTTCSTTLVIPHRNRSKDIQLCLESLKKLETVPEKIIVVDDCSLSSEQERLVKISQEGRLQNLEVYLLGKHFGTANAKNYGLMKCRSKFVWFLDSDTQILKANTLASGIDILNCHPEVVALGGEVVLDYSGKMYLREAKLLRSRWSVYRHYDLETEFIQRQVDMIPTNNFLTYTDRLKEIGGFHCLLENGEDKLASIQLTENGSKMMISSLFGVLHHQSTKERKKFQTRVRVYFRDTAYIYGATSNFTQVLISPFVFLFSLWEMYQSMMQMYHQFQQPKVPTSIKRQSKLNPGSLLKSLFDIGVVAVQYHLANKTVMTFKGYLFRRSNRGRAGLDRNFALMEATIVPKLGFPTTKQQCNVSSS